MFFAATLYDDILQFTKYKQCLLKVLQTTRKKQMKYCEKILLLILASTFTIQAIKIHNAAGECIEIDEKTQKILLADKWGIPSQEFGIIIQTNEGITLPCSQELLVAKVVGSQQNRLAKFWTQKITCNDGKERPLVIFGPQGLKGGGKKEVFFASLYAIICGILGLLSATTPIGWVVSGVLLSSGLSAGGYTLNTPQAQYSDQKAMMHALSAAGTTTATSLGGGLVGPLCCGASKCVSSVIEDGANATPNKLMKNFAVGAGAGFTSQFISSGLQDSTNYAVSQFGKLLEHVTQMNPSSQTTSTIFGAANGAFTSAVSNMGGQVATNFIEQKTNTADQKKPALLDGVASAAVTGVFTGGVMGGIKGKKDFDSWTAFHEENNEHWQALLSKLKDLGIKDPREVLAHGTDIQHLLERLNRGELETIKTEINEIHAIVEQAMNEIYQARDQVIASQKNAETLAAEARKLQEAADAAPFKEGPSGSQTLQKAANAKKIEANNAKEQAQQNAASAQELQRLRDFTVEQRILKARWARAILEIENKTAERLKEPLADLQATVDLAETPGILEKQIKDLIRDEISKVKKESGNGYHYTQDKTEHCYYFDDPKSFEQIVSLIFNGELVEFYLKDKGWYHVCIRPDYSYSRGYSKTLRDQAAPLMKLLKDPESVLKPKRDYIDQLKAEGKQFVTTYIDSAYEAELNALNNRGPQNPLQRPVNTPTPAEAMIKLALAQKSYNDALTGEQIKEIIRNQILQLSTDGFVYIWSKKISKEYRSLSELKNDHKVLERIVQAIIDGEMVSFSNHFASSSAEIRYLHLPATKSPDQAPAEFLTLIRNLWQNSKNNLDRAQACVDNFKQQQTKSLEALSIKAMPMPTLTAVALMSHQNSGDE